MKKQATPPSLVARREGFPYIYHLLHLANLRSIAEQGLLSRREVDARGISVSSLQSDPVRSARGLSTSSSLKSLKSCNTAASIFSMPRTFPLYSSRRARVPPSRPRRLSTPESRLT